MKISAPIYYKDFKCIADRCRHSCCVGWEICIDGDTLSRYGEAKGGYAEKIKSTVREIDGEYSFMLSEGERCPHLDERGLCRIIKSLGEGWLCEICREHPRFYNYVGDCLEVGLGASCEEAARIILSSPDYRSYLAVGEAEGEAAEATLGKVERERVFSFLRDTSRPYAERLEIISRKWRVNPEVLSVEMWREALSQLEYLDERDRELFLTYRSNPSRSGIAEPCERFLAYLIYRHL